ncbi:hypothetical protein EWM64_g7974 [Hericium alpestre]|uniref:THO1-MOS11 C-terminal domain-containing protein n=1 Tax=Hericium alpestre TaxID=135208 RepID=A0A4Y9ZRD2_9AGAM|nr:hypothetical protein EWM64_g7974 [Hericium alpestre]
MESKLKALKVVDLRDILSRASVPVPAKATKADLISKILASPPALNAYTEKYSPPTPSVPKDAPSAPSERIEPKAPKNGNQILTEAATASFVPKDKPSSSTAQPPKKSSKASPTAPSESASSSLTAPDDDLEKRKRRAERFGIPLVEAKPAATTNRPTSIKGVLDDPKKLNARAQRFGITTSADPKGPDVSLKRPAPTDDIDPEELERRRKRAERFGTTITA